MFVRLPQDSSCFRLDWRSPTGQTWCHPWRIPSCMSANKDAARTFWVTIACLETIFPSSLPEHPDSAGLAYLLLDYLRTELVWCCVTSNLVMVVEYFCLLGWTAYYPPAGNSSRFHRLFGRLSRCRGASLELDHYPDYSNARRPSPLSSSFSMRIFVLDLGS